MGRLSDSPPPDLPVPSESTPAHAVSERSISSASSTASPCPSPTLSPLPVSSYPISETVLQRPSRHVQFAVSPTHSVHLSEVSVQPYSEVYGIHPRRFDFDGYGNVMMKNQMDIEGRRSTDESLTDYLFPYYASAM